MEPLTQLFAVVGAVYASDCLIWAPRSSLALRALGSKVFRRAGPSNLLGNADAGWVWALPLPPLGTLLFSSAWPIAVSPRGVATREPLELELGARRAFRARTFRWSQIESIGCAERKVLINGAPFAVCDSARLARELAGRLDDWRQLDDGARAVEIEAALDATLDAREAQTRVEHHARATAGLRRLCIAMVGWIGIVSPLALYLHGGDLAWAIVLTGLIALHVSICWRLDRTFRALLPDCTDERRRAMLAMCLSPMGAARALDELSRPLLADLHPVAAAVLLPESERAEVVRATLVELRFPRHVEAPDPGLSEIEPWFGERLERRVRESAQRQGLDPGTLLAAPAAESDDSLSYCPRCRRQFTRDSGMCFDCTVALEPLRAA